MQVIENAAGGHLSIEERVNDLARRAHSARIVWESMCSELAAGATIADVEQTREVLQDMIEDLDVGARDLRVHFYAR